MRPRFLPAGRSVLPVSSSMCPQEFGTQIIRIGACHILAVEDLPERSILYLKVLQDDREALRRGRRAASVPRNCRVRGKAGAIVAQAP